MDRPPRVMLVAGEASGDRLGAGLARALRQERPGIELWGMGGDEMAAAGVRLIRHESEVAVMGLTEVVRHLPRIWRVLGGLADALREQRPDLVVPIDFPEFNLRLAARARKLEVPVVYFVSPQLWAWRRGRVRRVRELVRRMLVLFPFEVEFYRRAGVPVTFVGHPAVEAATGAVDRSALAARVGVDPARPIVLLLPGSREQEILRNLPPLLEAARLVRRRRADVQIVALAARPRLRQAIERAAESLGVEGPVVHEGDYPGILQAADAAAVSSGTATLEAGIAGLPMVVVYRVTALSYGLARLLVNVRHAALPNLIAGRRIVPELIQHDLTAERVAGELTRLLEDRPYRDGMLADLAGMRQKLGPPGAFDRAAAAVLAELPGGCGASTGAMLE